MGNSASKMKYAERKEQPRSGFKMAGTFSFDREQRSWADVAGCDPFENEAHVATFHVKTETSATVDTYLRTHLPPNISTHPTSTRLSHPRWPPGSKLITLFSELPDVLTARSAIQRAEKTPQLDELRDAWLYNPLWASARDTYMYYDPNDPFLPSPRELALNELSRQFHEREELRRWICAEMERREVEYREAERRRADVVQTAQGEPNVRHDGSPMSFYCVGANGKETRYRVVERQAIEAPAVPTPYKTPAARLPGVSSAPPFRTLCATPHASTSLPIENILLLTDAEVRIAGQPGLEPGSPSGLFEASSTAPDSPAQSAEQTEIPASTLSPVEAEEQEVKMPKNPFSKMPIRKTNLESEMLPASMYMEYDRARNVALGAEIDDVARDWTEVTECASLYADPSPPREWRPARAGTPYPGLRRIDAVADLKRVVEQQQPDSLTVSPVQRQALDFERQQKMRIERIVKAATFHVSPQARAEPIPNKSSIHGELVGNRAGLLTMGVQVVFE